MSEMTNAPRPSKRAVAGQRTAVHQPTAMASAGQFTAMQSFPQVHTFSPNAPAWTPHGAAPSQLPASPNASAPSMPQQQPSDMSTQLEQFGALMSQLQGMIQQFSQVCNSAQPTAVQPNARTVEQMMSQVSILKDQMKPFQQQQQQQQMPYTSSQTMANHFGDEVMEAPKPNRRVVATPGSLHGSAQPTRGGRGSGYSRGGFSSSRGGRTYVPTYSETEPTVIALVEFKRQRMKRYESDSFISPGHYVIVEGDRGLDCGFVIHCCVREPDGTITRTESIDNVQIDISRIKSESGHIVRVATEDDVKLLHGEIASSELIALKTCRELAMRMNLDMEIVDCEYQFDRKKISFYFEAPHSVDFRELNTELFRIFGVRIWLENLNSKVKNVVPEGALSHADKLQYTKNGLRPPRRT